MTASAAVERVRRAFGRGQGTTRRFVLLLVLFTAGSADLYGTVFQKIIDSRDFDYYCQLASGANPDSNDPQYFVEATAQSGDTGFSNCLRAHASGWRFAWLPFAATAAVLVLAVLLYLMLPAWQRRRRSLVPLGAVDPDRALREHLPGLEARAGLTVAPGYLVDLSAGGNDALVFGRMGGYTVRLDAGLVVLFRRERSAFEATMLHELAHVRNRDVDVTYLTVALWRVFLVCVLAPFAVTEAFALVEGLLGRAPSLFLPGELPIDARAIVLAVFIMALIYRVMADVLRVREHAADADAVASGADRVYWLRHDSAPVSSSSPAVRLGKRLGNRLRAAVRTHPDWPTRGAALLRPGDLTVLPAASMFVLGAATQLLAEFTYDSTSSDTASLFYNWLQIAGVWPAAILTTAVAASAVWREVAHALEQGRAAPSGLRAGFWLGLGQLAGEVVLGTTFGNGWFLPFPWILTLGLLVLVPAAVLWWTAGCAALWCRLPGRRAVLARWTVFAVAAGAFAVWSQWWRFTFSMYAAGDPFPESVGFADFYAGFPHTPTTDVMAVLTWPVASVGSGSAIWLTGALWLLPLLGGPRNRGARVTGTVCGCAAAVAVVLCAFRAHHWLTSAGASLDQNLAIYFAWLFAILWCAGIAAALVSVVRCPRSAVPAMTAAGIATVIGAGAVFLVNGTNGCIGPLAVGNSGCSIPAQGSWPSDWSVLDFLLPAAGLSSLILAGLTAGIMRTAGLRGSGPPADPAPRRPRRAAVLAVCLLLLAVCIGSYADFSGTESTPASLADAMSGVPGFAAEPSEVLDAQLSAWLMLGGGQDIDSLGSITQKLVTATGGADTAALARICRSAASLTTEARAYLLPPDLDLQQEWSAGWSDSSAGADACLAGLARRDSLLTYYGITEIQDGYDADLSLLARYYPLSKAYKF